ncbi:porin [Variovorax sp. ZS18.2.2]|uniref:porin n=1 Tax=Variovorax sp. ZS18.2.2 TaxID=2971255 RepID=UPI002151493D|nr:porin [Variovorax sp. ZS18.2.2]MCR6478299.1 porin [Variovorax sp. ZS18.2.2]
MAALAVAGVASAQSSVTLFGVVDASISGYSATSRDLNNGVTYVNGFPVSNPFYVNRGSVKVSKRALASSGYNGSRLGFRGTEDLGGGLAASFWLEAPITNDDGATGVASFKRRSTVSLSGGFGEVRLGRDYTPTFWNDTVFDPFGTNGVGTNLINTAHGYNTASFGAKDTGGFGGNTNYDRASNSIGYFLPPNLGGFYGQVMYAFHEQAKVKSDSAALTNAFYKDNNTARAGRYVGGRFGYANGPLDIALAYGSSTTGDQYQAGITNKVNTFNLGASYDFGPVKLFGEFSKAKNKVDYETQQFNIVDRVNGTDLTGYLLGVTVPVGAGLIRASYSAVKYDNNQPDVLFQPRIADPKASKLAIGYVHNLSRRTALYATVARISNKNGAALTTGGPAFFETKNGVFTPKTSTGYDFGIRHAF